MKFQCHLAYALAGIAFAVTAMSSTATYAAADPDHPTRIILHCPAGSPADLSVRDVAKWWSQHSGRSYYVKNVPNAPEIVGRGATAKSGTDEYSMPFDLVDCENEAGGPE